MTNKVGATYDITSETPPGLGLKMASHIVLPKSEIQVVYEKFSFSTRGFGGGVKHTLKSQV